jgi:hypothetical protein
MNCQNISVSFGKPTLKNMNAKVTITNLQKIAFVASLFTDNGNPILAADASIVLDILGNSTLADIAADNSGATIVSGSVASNDTVTIAATADFEETGSPVTREKVIDVTVTDGTTPPAENIAVSFGSPEPKDSPTPARRSALSRGVSEAEILRKQRASR